MVLTPFRFDNNFAPSSKYNPPPLLSNVKCINFFQLFINMFTDIASRPLPGHSLELAGMQN